MVTKILERKAAKTTLPMARPIRNDSELKKAAQLAFHISEAAETRRLSRDEADYLEVLLLLIEQYENAHYPIRKLRTARERLHALVETAGMSASDLGRLLGNRALGSKLLSGERELSKTHIHRLAGYFHVEPGFLL